jgi:hypothetical protein
MSYSPSGITVAIDSSPFSPALVKGFPFKVLLGDGEGFKFPVREMGNRRTIIGH